MGDLFLDTGDFGEIRKWIPTRAIRGVTTNPSLVAKSIPGGLSYMEYLAELVELFQDLSIRGVETLEPLHLSVEVVRGVTPDEVYEEAIVINDVLRGVKSYNVDAAVKIPSTVEMLPVISRLAANKIRVNATACMTALQGKMVADAGAAFVSFFYNRMKDHEKKTVDYSSHDHENHAGWKCSDPDHQIITYHGMNTSDAQTICGSIRKPEDVTHCFRLGIDHVTVGPKILEQMMKHPKTDEALEQFRKDSECLL